MVHNDNENEKNDLEKNDSVIEISAFTIEQPVGCFYVGKMEHSDLIKLCSRDMKEIQGNGKYDIYQRKLNTDRIPSLQAYMEYSRATFPNGIILNSNYPISFSNGLLRIANKPDAFFIIDGQHRIEALKYYKGEKRFEICVVIFDHIKPDIQTDIFATVNSEQKPVNATVKLNLKGTDTVDTPEKVVRTIAIALNEEKKSPFRNRIKFSDEPVKREELKISLAAFAKPIVTNIYNTENSFEVKDCLYTHKNDRLSLLEAGIEFPKKVLWDYYVKSDEDFIYSFLMNYFTAIKDIFPNDWDDKKSLLSKTSGYNALMLLFKDILGNDTDDMSYEFLFSYLKPLGIMRGKFTLQNIGVGNSAVLRLYRAFCKILNSPESSIDVNDIFEE